MFAVLALVGAGCVQGGTQVESDTQAEVQMEESNENKEGEEGSMDAEAKAEAGATVETEVEIEGGSVTIKTEQDANVETEDGVPVVEIELGASVDVSVDMKSGNFFFEPNVIRAGAGERIKVTFTQNSGFHTFVIDEANVNFAINQGEALTFAAPTEPGEYPFYCSIGSHRSFGMEGTLIVE